ncbi:hypothetical protein OOJ09_31925, partial [Mesorhizobium qingshengii]|nr:hypothetical protein [Mesorhizobium qingshengii]
MPGLRIVGYRRAVSIAFAVEGERVLILGIFYAGHNITPELLEERFQNAARAGAATDAPLSVTGDFQADGAPPGDEVMACIIEVTGNRTPLTIGPSQLTIFDPVGISTRNRKKSDL